MKNVDVNISSDKFTAYLSINCKGPGYPAKDELLKELRSAGVTFGIDHTLLDKIISEEKPVKDLRIATGTKPVRGKDAQLVWHLENEVADEKVQIDEAGLADFKHAKSFNEVQAGEEIVSLLPKISGQAGRTVTGETIPSGEKDLKLPVGENVKVSEDGLTLFATKSGFVNFNDGKIDISNRLQIKGDVNFNTGNVKYDGEVLIKGDVRSGFRVEATDSVIIEGDVEAADIRSKKGDVTIKMGVLGKGRAKIVAGQNVYCGFIQDAEVKANHDVSVNRYIINGDVYAGGYVKVNQHEGLIRGGKVFGEKGIEVKEAGSVKNISTNLGIGLNRNPEQESLLVALVQEEDKLYTRYELISKKERFLKLLYERVDKFSEEKKAELEAITQELKEIQDRLKEIDEEKKEMSEKNRNIAQKNKIIVSEKLHKGVVINAGVDEIFIDKLYEKVVIYQDLNNLVIDDLKIEQE